jgi:hypothetical protein
MNQAVKSPKRSALRGYAFAATSVLLGLGISLTAAEWILKYQRLQVEGSDRMDPGMILYDPRLGWRLAADWAGTHHNWISMPPTASTDTACGGTAATWRGKGSLPW